MDLTNSSGSFVRTKLLNNTPIVVSSLDICAMVVAGNGTLIHLFLQMGYGAVVTVSPNGESVKVEFEDSTFANDVANLVRIRLELCPDNRIAVDSSMDCVCYRNSTSSFMVAGQRQLIVIRLPMTIATASVLPMNAVYP